MKKSQYGMILLAAVVGLANMACESRLTGKEGNLEFAYYGTGDVRDFNKPLALGAMLDLRVYEAPNGEDVVVHDADFDPPGVLSVEEIEGNTIVLAGQEHGRTEIRAEAELLDGEIVEDFVDMRAGQASRLELEHYCTAESQALYLTEQEVWLPFSFYDDNDEQLIGYGYHPVELVGDTEASVMADAKDQVHLHLDTGATAGSLSLESTIDDTALQMELVAADAIDDMAVEVGSSAQVNHSTTMHFQPQVDGQRVCQPILDFEIENLTPDICDVRFEDVAEGSQLFQELGVIAVEGRQAGECRVRGFLDDQDVSVEGSVTIEP